MNALPAPTSLMTEISSRAIYMAKRIVLKAMRIEMIARTNVTKKAIVVPPFMIFDNVSIAVLF